MPNEHVIIIGMALLIYWLMWGGRVGLLAAILSAIMIAGALRHPEIAPSGQQMEGTPDEQLQTIMLMCGLILLPPLAWWWLKGLSRRGGR